MSEENETSQVQSSQNGGLSNSTMVSETQQSHSEISSTLINALDVQTQQTEQPQNIDNLDDLKNSIDSDCNLDESTKKQLEKNPPINEKMIRAMFMQMGRKPSEAQIKAVMKSMNQHR